MQEREEKINNRQDGNGETETMKGDNVRIQNAKPGVVRMR